MPDSALGGLAREGKLGQGEGVVEFVKDDVDALANSDMLLRYWLQLVIDQIRHQAQAVVLGRDTALLIQLHHHDGVGGKVSEARLDGMDDDFIAVMVPLPLTACQVQSSAIHQGQAAPGGKRIRLQALQVFTTSVCCRAAS